MQVRTFTGPNASSVLAQIKEEMGPDAVILSSRDCKIKDSVWHEITAGIERLPESTIPGQGDAAQAAPPGWAEWHRDWNQIKEHLLALMKPGINLEALSPRQRLAVEYLVREGMDDQTLFRLYKNLLAKADTSVLEALGDLVPIRSWGIVNWPQEIHVIAGPFGVGKTTAALRMALALREKDSRLPILFLNADCDRGNGRLLLRHYADLSAMEYAEAGTAEQCLAALRKWGSETGSDGKILVDLPGASRDRTLADQLQQLGLTGSGIALHLALSPLSGSAQQADFLRRYNCQGMEGRTSIIWTKLDEASSYGPLLNTGAATGLPISALSYGAGLADTLTPAHSGHVWRLVFKHEFP
jgi:flagellar biosynthesis protein FlhF